jgi:uncharacterized membrane protein
MQTLEIQSRSLPERVFHAVLFEVIATSICAPVGAFMLDKPLLQVGMLTVVLATTAMLWNIVYNVFFDKFWPAELVTRTFKVRALHALGFESGFILIGVNIAAWMLNISLIQAFMLEIGFFLFFLPYTMLYNWVYDVCRAKLNPVADQAC